MKAFVFVLALCCSALAEDGYKKELQLIALQKEAHRAGDVYKIRQFKAENEGSEKEPSVVFYTYTRHTGFEVKVTMTTQQWILVKHSQIAFIRRNSTGWEYLGTRTSRDQKGKLIFDY